MSDDKKEGGPARHPSIPSHCPECEWPTAGPDGLDFFLLEERAEVMAHVNQGHTYHCAARVVWGDGECECGLVARGRNDVYHARRILLFLRINAHILLLSDRQRAISSYWPPEGDPLEPPWRRLAQRVAELGSVQRGLTGALKSVAECRFQVFEDIYYIDTDGCPHQVKVLDTRGVTR